MSFYHLKDLLHAAMVRRAQADGADRGVPADVLPIDATAGAPDTTPIDEAAE